MRQDLFQLFVFDQHPDDAPIHTAANLLANGRAREVAGMPFGVQQGEPWQHRVGHQGIGDGVFERGWKHQIQAHQLRFFQSVHAWTPCCEEMAWPNRRYSTGSRTRVSAVELTSPPITTMASGRWISEPGPLASSRGTRPKAVMEAVISTGRSRRSEPSRTTCSMGRPSACRWLKCVTSTNPLSTAMPSSAMKPTEAGTDRYSPAALSAAMPPTSANGMLAMTSSACLGERKVSTSSTKMAPSASRSEERRVGKEC